MHGATPLHIAAMNDYADSVNAMIDAGAHIDVEDKDGVTPIFRVKGKEVLISLMNAGADINAKDEIGGQTPLYLATDRGHSEAVKVLIDSGADLNAKDKKWRYAP